MIIIRSLCLLAACEAFSPLTPRIHNPQRASTQLAMSEPSDTSSDPFYDDDTIEEGVVTVDSQNFTPTASEALITNMLDMVPSALAEVSESKRAAINEALLKLEALNPTKNPTMSPFLNGVWELRYAGGYSAEGALPSPTRQIALFLYSGGYSPGLFALGLAQKLPSNLVDVGNLEISICREQPRVEAKVDVKSLLGESSVTVKAKLEVESDIRMRETYESATVLERDVEIPEAVRYSRELYVTYVDEDILVVRDGSGVPELLIRKEKTFSRDWGTEPSEMEDMAPPGEE